MMRKYAAALALASSMLCGAPAAPGAGIGPAAAHQGSAAVTTGPSSLPAPDDDRVSAPARAPGARALTGWHPFVQDTVNRVAVDDSPAAPWRLHMVARRLADRPDGWHVSAAVVGESLGPLPVDSIVPTIERARASGKRFEFVFQSYSTELQRWPGSKPGPGRYPSRDEMRAMAYLGVVHGASGLWTWAYSYIQDAPGSEWHWTELLSLARELRLLGPLLASPSVGDARANISDSAIHACLKAYRGMDYLITVNASPARTAARIRLEARPLSTARELFSDRATPVRGGEIADEWSGYDVRIYELGPG